MIRERAPRATTAPLPPDAAQAASAVAIRRVETLAEYRACVALQEATWGEGFSERVPSSVLLVTQKLGGVVVGAFRPDGTLVGFVFGMTGPMHGRLVHWSDMLAVRPEARGGGIGERLKRHQRDLVRALGVETMHWTFDPLVARNARLNLVRLGARATAYVPDMYGDSTGSPLHGGMPTDRLVVTWDLTRDDQDVPAPPALAGRSGVRIAVPHDVHALPPQERAAWRAATRAAFLAHLARGYRIVAFRRGDDDAALPYYELARDAAPAPAERAP